MPTATADLSRFLGREPERMSLEERQQAAGNWIALQIYTPATLPLRRIEAIADSPAGCIAQLNSRGLDARLYEFSLLTWPC
jgi:hypothetical protein